MPSVEDLQITRHPILARGAPTSVRWTQSPRRIGANPSLRDMLAAPTAKAKKDPFGMRYTANA